VSFLESGLHLGYRRTKTDGGSWTARGANMPENKIADDRWVPRIWEDLFFRVRLTMRYCEICKRAFCEGELIKRTVRPAV
jgi:hypothetical protein